MSPADAIEVVQVRDAAPLFAALGDLTRLRLFVRLSSSGPESISRLSAKTPVSRQAVTKHLNVLSRVGLIRGNRRGRERIWQVEPKRLADARLHLDRISRLWDDALGRLQRHVERQA